MMESCCSTRSDVGTAHRTPMPGCGATSFPAATRLRCPILKTRFGGADRFIRMWEYYLAGFEASFRSYGLAVFQIQLIKNIDAVPPTRGYMYENKDERTSNWKINAAAE